MSAGPFAGSPYAFSASDCFSASDSSGRRRIIRRFLWPWGGLMIIMWVYVAVMRGFGNTAFEMETIAFFFVNSKSGGGSLLCTGEYV